MGSMDNGKPHHQGRGPKILHAVQLILIPLLSFLAFLCVGLDAREWAGLMIAIVAHEAYAKAMDHG
jgi:hypothetical protein